MRFNLLPATLGIVLLSVGAGIASAAEPLQGDAAAGQAKAATCVACHGVDGNSVNPEWPTLAGQHEKYIAKQLAMFKAGTRQNPLMTPMAAPLSPQDMQDLGAYFATKTARGLEADKSKVDLGQKLYRGGNAANGTPACIACHGPNGRGNPGADYPSIRGQYAIYMAAQLNAYKSGQRTTDAARVMRDIAAKLSAEEIAAVASYMQGLR
jgi:cytochrome c553